jgi:DNA-binding FrmR family transcriptional regulator
MKYTPSLKNRLSRAEGQIRGIIKMIENDSDCRNIVTQLSAVRSAIDKTMAHIVAANLEECIIKEYEKGADTSELVQQAIELLVKSR